VVKKPTAREKFGDRVRVLRKKIGLSQEQFGFKVGLHRTYVGSIERGEQNVSLDNIIKLAKAFKIKLTDLFKSI